jgi:hypothetical protein
MVRMNYWSSSAFAAWLRKIGGLPESPASATRAAWRAWRKECEASNPGLNWIIEEGFDRLQYIACWPADRLHDIRSYIRYRFTDRLHYLPTRLPPGQYRDLDTRILHALMESLVDFVEIEEGRMGYIAEPARGNNYVARPRRWWRSFRCAAAGIDYLEWQATLDSIEEDPDHGVYRCDRQAHAAREILALYRWWKIDRPNRPDPYVASGWQQLHSGLNGCSENSPDCLDGPWRPDTQAAVNKLTEIEQAYLDEDQAMLQRLMAIRPSLWT